MKKILILLVCLLPVITFTSCDDKDDIRKDIDDLNARLDALTDDLENLNTSIKSFQDAVKGLVLVTGYTMDEKGNYTLSLSDGTELVVYGGQPAGDIPTLGINEAGNWTYTLDGRTVELKDKEGNPCPAVPVDGSDGQTPTISIDADGVLVLCRWRWRTSTYRRALQHCQYWRDSGRYICRCNGER